MSCEIRQSAPVLYLRDKEDMITSRLVIRDLPGKVQEVMLVRQGDLVWEQVLFAVRAKRLVHHRRIALLKTGLFQKVLR